MYTRNLFANKALKQDFGKSDACLKKRKTGTFANVNRYICKYQQVHLQIKGCKNAVMDFQKAQNRGNLEKCYEKKLQA